MVELIRNIQLITRLQPASILAMIAKTSFPEMPSKLIPQLSPVLVLVVPKSF